MIDRVQVDGKEVILVGTAHVSRDSIAEVRQVIADAAPDTVCVELDQDRYEALQDEERWQDLDVREAIRDGKGGVLLLNVALSIYQRKLGQQFDVQPGEEMLAAVEAAADAGSDLALIDRDIQDTLTDLRRQLTWREKLRLFTDAVGGFVAGGEELDAADVEALKEQDALTTLMEELGDSYPAIDDVLLEKRNAVMATNILDADGDTIVAVVGAAHVAGIADRLRTQRRETVEPVEPSFSVLKALKYGVPVLILAMFAAIFLQHGTAVLGDAVGTWVLLNAGGAALGALAARAHPATVVVAAAAAPFTSVNPAVPAGLVAAYAEHRFDPPTVGDLEAIGEVSSYRAFWDNTALNLLLVFLLVNMGSAVATYVGGGYLANILL